MPTMHDHLFHHAQVHHMLVVAADELRRWQLRMQLPEPLAHHKRFGVGQEQSRVTAIRLKPHDVLVADQRKATCGWNGQFPRPSARPGIFLAPRRGIRIVFIHGSNN